MNDINPLAHQHSDIRQAVRDVCRAFDSAYWQKVEEVSGYPEAFVQALTQAGWLAALIPEEYGGGASLTEASVIPEYDVERKFRETRLYQVAPISTNLILSYLGEHVLGMPRSF